MRVLVAGDLHFGAGYSYGRPEEETGNNSRLIDYNQTLTRIIDYAISEKIELFVFLGDIFEKSSPAPHQMVYFYRQLIRLSNAKITTYILMGNHDAIKTRKINSSLDPLKELNIPGVCIFTDLDLVKFIDSNNEALNLLMVPYRNRQSYDAPSKELAIMEMKREFSIAASKADSHAPILACVHMMFENTIPLDAGEYGLNELILPFKMFDGIDTTICGHIHRSSVLQKEPLIIYSGSLECRDFSEREHNKVFLIYDTSKSGLERVEFRPIKTRKFVDFDIDFSNNFPENPMENIIDQINEANINDAVVRFIVKVPETKASDIDITMIRRRFYERGANLVSNVVVLPILSKQLRNVKVNEATDDISAFKYYITSQNDVEETVLEYGLNIIEAENA